MNNIEDLTKELTAAFHKVKDDRRYCPQAHEMGNLAGKLLHTQRVQLDYAKMKGVKPNVDFLETK